MSGRCGIIISITCFVLVACTVASQYEANDQSSATPTLISILNTVAVASPKQKPTATLPLDPIATKTPNIQFTSTPIPPTLTPARIPVSTFDPSQAVTRTPQPPAQCPLTNPNPVLPDPYDLPEDNKAFEAEILDILNSGGAKLLYDSYFKPAKWPDGYYGEWGLAYADLTHDNVAELVMVSKGYPGNLYVFGCVDGKYQTLLIETAFYDHAPSIASLRDLNMNGTNDLAIVHLTCSYCTGVRVYEWDGQQLQSLVRDWFIDDENQLKFDDVAELNGYTQARIEDVDGNGTYEIVLDGGQPSWLGAIAGGEGPYREQVVVYMWDGQYFIWHSQQYDPAIFRFEAIQDGDTATLRGDYETAITLYQAAIFSDMLRSWTANAWFRLVEENISQQSLAYPDASKMPFNQIEFDQLAAYARYRIMLIYIAKGWDSDAKTLYETLQRIFPEENAGHPYAEMATRFQDSFQTSRDMGIACKESIGYAQEHGEILLPLGSGDQGLFSRRYAPEDICPFKSK